MALNMDVLSFLLNPTEKNAKIKHGIKSNGLLNKSGKDIEIKITKMLGMNAFSKKFNAGNAIILCVKYI